jgi:hypothetical protein
VLKRTRRYGRSKRVKVATAKRATQVHTLLTRKKPSSDADLNASKNTEQAGEQEAQKQGTGTAIKPDVQRMSAYLRERTKTNKSVERFIALNQISALASAVTSEMATDLPVLRRLHIDYAHSISIGVHKEKYFLLMTLDRIDFTFCSATVDRTEPESLIHEFTTFQGGLRQKPHHGGGNCYICLYNRYAQYLIWRAAIMAIP